MNRKLLVVLGLAVLASAPATAAPSCLEIGEIWNWDAPNDRTVIVEDNWHQKFKLTLMTKCINLTFKDRVEFKLIGEYTRLACISKGDEVLVHDPGMPQRCPIVDVVRYTPEMEKADKAAAAAAKAKRDSE